MARVLMVVAVAAMMCLGVQAASAAEEDCINFCPDPTGSQGSYRCCDEHPGNCPPVRLSCPGPIGTSPDAKECFFDPDCFPKQKCCRDVCLPHKVCKATKPHGSR